jgi:hypothetical protein
MVTHRALRVGAVTLAAAALAGLATAALLDATASGASKFHAVSYHFRTLDNRGDLTFNELLGINNKLVIAGYFGSGATGHPSHAYLLVPPRYGQRDYRNLDFPGPAQTQVNGLNDHGVYVGFGLGQDGAFGWYAMNGVSHEVNFAARDQPHQGARVDELLGVNNDDVAVGFYVDASGNAHGYEYDIGTHSFSAVTESGAKYLVAAAINNRGEVAGFYFTNPGTSHAVGFIRYRDGTSVDLRAPGACSTWAMGVNDTDEVVGVYTPCGRSTATAMDGFTWTPQAGFATVNDPDGVGTTTINGVNDDGDLVGSYTTDHGKITNGMLATP